MSEPTYPSPDVDAWGTGYEYAPSESSNLEGAQLIVDVLELIRGELSGIRQAAESQRADMEAIRELTEQLIEEAQEQDDEPPVPIEPIPEPDYYPFADMPAGTAVRDLPSGGRLFLLPDGLILRTGARREVVAVGADGELIDVELGPGGVITVTPGMELQLASDFLQLTHEAAGIAGLPIDVQPIFTAFGRVCVNLPCGTRLDIHQNARVMTLVNRSGTIGIIAAGGVEAIGEEVETRLITNGPRTFAFLESGHRGVIDADGTIRIALASGLDLIIMFPAVGDESNPPTPESSICSTCGIRHLGGNAQ